MLSEPIIVEFTNNASETVSLSIFDAFKNASKLANGNFITNYGLNIKISVVDAGAVTYGVLLQSLKTQNYTFGSVYIQSANSNQLSKTIQVTQKDSFGNTKTDVIFPKLDPNQGVDTVLIVDSGFYVDGYTKLTIDLLGDTTLNLSLYPSEMLDSSKTLIGEDVINQYRIGSFSQFKID